MCLLAGSGRTTHPGLRDCRGGDPAAGWVQHFHLVEGEVDGGTQKTARRARCAWSPRMTSRPVAASNATLVGRLQGPPHRDLRAGRGAPGHGRDHHRRHRPRRRMAAASTPASPNGACCRTSTGSTPVTPTPAPGRRPPRPRRRPARAGAGDRPGPRRGLLGQDAFTIDWDNQHVTCPNGITSTQWHRRSEETSRDPGAVLAADCRTCPSPGLRAPPQAQRRRSPCGPATNTKPSTRPGSRAADRRVEGALQDPCRCRRHHLPRSRALRPAQIPLPRPHQDQPPAPTHRSRDQPRPHRRPLTDTPRARTRTSHFAALRPAENADGAKQSGPD